jgi:hypothetical protein
MKSEPANSAPENAFRLDYCKKCIQMTNHSYNKETGETQCQKCKPEKKVRTR